MDKCYATTTTLRRDYSLAFSQHTCRVCYFYIFVNQQTHYLLDHSDCHEYVNRPLKNIEPYVVFIAEMEYLTYIFPII